MDGFEACTDSERQVLLSLPEHISAGLSADVGEFDEAERVCMFGFGFSTTAIDLLSSYSDDCSPTHVVAVSDRTVPRWVGKGTDVILLSYSGNTAEILDVFDTVTERGCRVLCITSGGRLLPLAREAGVRTLLLPSGMSARTATGYEIGLLSKVLQAMGACDAEKDMRALLPSVEAFRDSMAASDDVVRIADALSGKVPAIYGTVDMRAAFRRWKLAINEDAGSIAFFGDLPEFDHNELVGWFDDNEHAPELRIVVLKGKTDSKLLDFIVCSMIDILHEVGRPVQVVDFEGRSLQKSICGIIMGDAVAKELAGRCRVDG